MEVEGEAAEFPSAYAVHVQKHSFGMTDLPLAVRVYLKGPTGTLETTGLLGRACG